MSTENKQLFIIMATKYPTPSRQRPDVFNVCVKCLFSIPSTEPIGFEFLFGEHWVTCHASDKDCLDRQDKCRDRHRREIAHRMKFLAGGHLVVIRDLLGHHFDTYGNYYLKVEEGADPLQRAEQFIRAQDETWGSLAGKCVLIVEEILSDGAS
jgi:hypothetical protein